MTKLLEGRIDLVRIERPTDHATRYQIGEGPFWCEMSEEEAFVAAVALLDDLHKRSPDWLARTLERFQLEASSIRRGALSGVPYCTRCGERAAPDGHVCASQTPDARHTARDFFIRHGPHGGCAGQGEYESCDDVSALARQLAAAVHGDACITGIARYPEWCHRHGVRHLDAPHDPGTCPQCAAGVPWEPGSGHPIGWTPKGGGPRE